MAAEIHFEWDPRKSAANRRRHEIDFDEAREAFFDPLKKLELEGTEHGEVRWRTIGEIRGAIYVVSHTLDEEDEVEIVRIISARRATARERRAYEREA
jgi:uncharacterized DUF497 family protein